MTLAAPSTIIRPTPSATGMDRARPPRYRAPMTTSANSVITAIEARRPGLRPGKQHLLLFFAQGHHLAWAGEPLFPEALAATERGVTVHDLTPDPAPPISDEARLGTITNVVVRYSGLSPAELRTLIQASTPWQLARKAGDDTHIEPAWLAEWFRRAEETDDPDDERPTRAERAEAEAYLASRGRP